MSCWINGDQNQANASRAVQSPGAAGTIIPKRPATEDEYKRMTFLEQHLYDAGVMELVLRQDASVDPMHEGAMGTARLVRRDGLLCLAVCSTCRRNGRAGVQMVGKNQSACPTCGGNIQHAG